MNYLPSKSIRISYRLIAFLFQAIGIFILFDQLSADSSPAHILLLAIAAILTIGGLLIFLKTVRTGLSINNHYLTLTRFFSSKSIPVDEIKAYRYGPYNTFYLITPNGALRIPRSLQSANLITWIKARYPDIAVSRLEQATADLLNQDRFGQTPEERQSRLNRARGLEDITIAITFLLLLWSYFYPKPLGLVMPIAFLLPIAAVYWTWRSQGLLKLYKGKASPFPSLRLSMILSVISAACITQRYHIYEFSQNAWTVLLAMTGLLAAAVIVACWKGIRDARQKWLIGILVIAFTMAYCFFLVMYANCCFDGSEPDTIEVKVLSKHMTYGRGANYYLNLDSWGRFAPGEDLTVPHSLYKEVQPGDNIIIHLSKGSLNIPWFYMSAADK